MTARVWLMLGMGLAIAHPALAQPAPPSAPTSAGAPAQPLPRIAAAIVAFDDDVLTLQPAGTTEDADQIKVAIRPDTRYVSAAKFPLAQIRPGDFAGAAVIADPDGKLRAQEVHLYPGPLRGTGEGRFAEGAAGRLMINGTVATNERYSMTLHYRGAAQNNGVCEGRAKIPISGDACIGDAIIRVAPGVPVTVLIIGDKSLLLPGAMVAVSVATGPDGKKFTPGLIVEKPPPKP